MSVTDEEKSDSVQKKAAVAPTTVEKIGNGKQELPKPQPKKRARRQPKAEVTTITPHPMAWEAALALADGNLKLLLTLDTGSVIVMNHPKQFKRNEEKK